MQSTKTTSMLGSDDLWLNLDDGVLGALYRAVIGFATIPAMRLVLGRDGSDWSLVPFLLLILLLLRVGAAVARKVLPFSQELREAWSVRRRIAKRYDSYQWRKLMWVGIGIASYLVISGHYATIPMWLSMFCIATGAAASMRWRAISTDDNYPKPVARKFKAPAQA